MQKLKLYTDLKTDLSKGECQEEYQESSEKNKYNRCKNKLKYTITFIKIITLSQVSSF